MTTSLPVSTFFREEPVRWGLRGDPWLWREMQQRLSDVEAPGSAEELIAIIEQTFQELTGFSVSCSDAFHLEKYSHGGMSSGMISPEFWRETAIPLLRQRYLQR